MELKLQKAIDFRYMSMAYVWANNSHAKHKVGALLVKDRMIISDGYNSTPCGFDNICEEDDGSTKLCVLHAESNAITKVAKSTISCDGATLYVTLSPCFECAKLIIQAGIKRVVYGELYLIEQYDCSRAKELLHKAGIEVNQINI